MATKAIKPKFFATVTRNGTDARPFTIQVIGRDAWALLSLMHAGPRGCTPIDRPAPRWSHYIFKLRSAGVHIETLDETHDGSFSGSHGRYVLRDTVAVEGGNLAEYLASPEGRREFPYHAFAQVA